MSQRNWKRSTSEAVVIAALEAYAKRTENVTPSARFMLGNGCAIEAEAIPAANTVETESQLAVASKRPASYSI